MRPPGKPPVLVAVLLGLVGAVGCTTDPEGGEPPRTGVVLSTERARAALAELPRTSRWPDLAPYSREAFGEAWADVDGNGCNQRDDVLLRDAVPGSVQVRRQGDCDHDVMAGSWVDPYTGATVTFDDLKDPAQAQAIQIDHVVPLAEAWRSGASEWNPARRERFANDPTGLVAADGESNASKGSSDPAAWLPRKRYQCLYARRWVGVKARWDLAVDDSEVRALGQMLDRCG